MKKLNSLETLAFTAIGVAMVCLAVVVFTASRAQAVADLDTKLKPWSIVTVTAGTPYKVLCTNEGTITFKHLGVQGDGTTASTDRLILQHESDATDATLNDGDKLAVFPSTSQEIFGYDAKQGTDGQREVQLNATANSIKVQIFRSRK